MYISYMFDNHTLHSIVWCSDDTDDKHLVVCESNCPVQKGGPSNQCGHSVDSRTWVKVIEQKNLYASSELGNRRSDRVAFDSQWHRDHWDYRATLRI